MKCHKIENNSAMKIKIDYHDMPKVDEICHLGNKIFREGGSKNRLAHK